MTFWGILVGLILGFLPITYLLKVKRLRFVDNPYLRGVILGTGMWLLVYLILYIEARFSLFGFLEGEQGFGTMMILSSSLQGFLTAGIISAFILKKLKKI